MQINRNSSQKTATGSGERGPHVTDEEYGKSPPIDN